MNDIEIKFKIFFKDIDINDGDTGSDMFYVFESGYKLAKKELEEQLKETISEFKNCYKALEFFEKHADCRTNNVYHCNCNFCKDREHSMLKRNAKAYLEKWK